MKKIIISLLIIGVLLSISSPTIFGMQTYGRNILYVGGSGPGNYTTIQDAIYNASEGDTIRVKPGTYYENIVIYKKLYIVGEDRETTIIDGMENGDVVYIVANDVNISGFRIQNSSLYPQTPGRFGILLDSCSGCNINNNIVIDTSYAIRIPKNSNSNLISNNILKNNQHTGVWVGDFWEYSEGDNKIQNNTIIGGWTAINLDFSSKNEVKNNFIKNLNEGIIATCSERTIVENNSIEHATDFGIRFYLSNYSIAVGNIVRNCTHQFEPFPSILLLDSSGVLVSKNRVTNTDEGIVILSSNGNNISENIIEKSEYYGIYITYNSYNNKIYFNNLINNNINGWDNCNNIWDNGYPCGGNYWDDYTGKDENHDGIGDTPYNISGGDNKDYYPLITPYCEAIPYPPIISGPTSGKTGISYTYNFSSRDPNDDNVYYYVAWGDGTNSSWLGPYASGAQASAAHIWIQKGMYTIKVKAKDIHGAESNWATLPVTMPLDLISSHSQSLLSLLKFALVNKISLFTVILQNIQTTTIISGETKSSDAPTVINSDVTDDSTTTDIIDTKTSDDTKTTDNDSDSEKPTVNSDNKQPSINQNTENNKITITTK